MDKIEEIILTRVLFELERARLKHPKFPTDIIHQTAIMMEEAGEAVQAANDHVHSGDTIQALEAELIQTAAMCVRCLESIAKTNRR